MTHRPWASQFGRFVGVGGSATLLMYLLLVAGVELADMRPLHSSAAAYVLSALFNYWANYHFTFASQASHRVALPRFSLIAACGLAINAAIMWLLTEPLNWHYLPAQLIATAVVLFWNFFANRRWTYGSAHPSSRPQG